MPIHYCECSIDCKSITKCKNSKYAQGHQVRVNINPFTLPHVRIKVSGENNPSFRPEVREKIRKKFLGVPKSEEHCKHLSESHKGKHSSPSTQFKKGDNKGIIPKTAGYGRGKGIYYNSPYQEKIWLRSSYELAYARWLDKNKKDWLYEACTFDLDNTTYTPDFYLIKDNKFIEIKGWMQPESKKKIDLTIEKYNIDLYVLFGEDLKKIGALQ